MGKQKEITNFSLSNFPPEFLKDLQSAVKILKNAGGKEIYLFGSLKNNSVNENSDIDIAVKGLDKANFFQIWGELFEELEHTSDLINLDDTENRFVRYLLENQELIRIA